jgi:hypothetical protein
MKKKKRKLRSEFKMNEWRLPSKIIPVVVCPVSWRDLIVEGWYR